MTLQEIQEKYPDPQRAGSMSDGYCVGGAVCLASGYWQDKGFYHIRCFPHIHLIAEALKKLNPFLSNFLSSALARNIVSANDEGDFKTAYGYVEQALEVK